MSNENNMKTIVVTGASRGIGRGIADHLQQNGYHVIGVSRSEPEGDPEFEWRQADVSDYESLRSAFSDLRRKSNLYALINSAAVASMNLLPITPPETIDRLIGTNLIGTIYCCRALSPALIKSKGRRIINLSSVGVQLGLKGVAVYVASKAGVDGFTRSFAREMADHNITVNVISPGPIDTFMISRLPDEQVDAVVDRQIIQRRGDINDINNIVSLLLSPESDMITGEIIKVGGI